MNLAANSAFAPAARRAGALAVMLAAALAGAGTSGCQSGGGGDPGGGGGGGGGGETVPASTSRGTSDAEGSVVAGVARISRIDRSTVNQDGKVRYVLDNVSGADQEDLLWSVSFLFPGRSVGAGAISTDEQAETTSEKTLILLRGEQGKVLEAQCGALAEHRARGETVIGTRLNVAPNPPVPTLARTASQRGTMLASGRLECVGQSDIESPASPTELVLEFENLSSAKVSDLELQVLFVSSRVRSKWRAIPAMAPGQRGRVVVDLQGLDIGDRSFLVKIQQQAL